VAWPPWARSKRQHNEERCEPSVPVQWASSGPPDPAHLTRASEGLDQARVIVLQIANPHVISAAG
jgi:hypothetical protein